MNLNEIQTILFTISVKLGIIACLASILMMTKSFKRLLLIEKKTPREKTAFSLTMGVLLTIGLISRLMLGYQAADISLAGAVMIGMIGGMAPGVFVGLLLGSVAFMAGEYLALPLGIIYGISGGILYNKRPKEVDPLNFPPLPPVVIYQAVKQWRAAKKIHWQLYPLLTCVILDSLRMGLGRFTGLVFSLASNNALIDLLILLSTAACIGIPLKIWSNARTEQKLIESNARAAEAKLEALRSQIRPHFLFNTLNTISALVRVDPEQGRSVILKLSGLLRRLFDESEGLIPLKKELEFIDDYLSIEQIRHGNKLRIVKEIDDSVGELLVPGMVLQPIIENSIKHGLAPKLDQGEIKITARKKVDGAEITISDNGIGIDAFDLDRIKTRGVGLRNVEERLQAAYSRKYRFDIKSNPADGTKVTLFFPEES